MVLTCMGRAAEAVSALRVAYALDPQRLETAYNFCLALWQSDRQSQAVSLFQRVSSAFLLSLVLLVHTADVCIAGRALA